MPPVRSGRPAERSFPENFFLKIVMISSKPGTTLIVFGIFVALRIGSGDVNYLN